VFFSFALYLQKTGSILWSWLVALGGTTSLAGCFQEISNIVILRFRLRAADRATPGVPDLNGPNEQKVEWWSLRKAGYEPVVYPEALFDPNLGLVGKPWRVLRLGDQRIPIFRREDDGPIFFQHRVRMAAYCHLLEVTEGMTSPFGILLDRKTRQGTALLFTEQDRANLLHSALQKARQVIAKDEQGKKPSAPKPTFCRGCQHGKPVAFHADESNPNKKRGISLPVFPLQAESGRLYHCHCGDRFQEMPPHEKVGLLGLRS
jgi:hypothetical protein